MNTLVLRVYCNGNFIMLTFMSFVQTVNSHRSFSSDFDTSKLNLNLKETSRNLIVSNVKTLLQLNPTNLRTIILDNNISLDINKLLSEKGVYIYNDSSLNDFYSYFTNFIQLVSKTCVADSKYKCTVPISLVHKKNEIVEILECGCV